MYNDNITGNRYAILKQSWLIPTGVDCATASVARYFPGRVPNFNQSEARKQCFLIASDRLKFRTLPGKYLVLYLKFT